MPSLQVGLDDLEDTNPNTPKSSPAKRKAKSPSKGAKKAIKGKLPEELQEAALTLFLSLAIAENSDSPSTSAPSSSTTERTSMIVGVDFGTTFSGISTVNSTDDVGLVKVMRNWPGLTENYDKVPSTISYDNETLANSPCRWGYQVGGEMKSSTWFKLLLVQDAATEEHDDPLLRQCAGKGLMRTVAGKQPAEICRDYLRCLYNHVLETLKMECSASVLGLTRLHFVLATPAGWKDHERARIEIAAKLAGFGTRPNDKITLVTEPEAAALAAFDNYQRRFGLSSPLKDLITYKITKTKPFTVEEACVGTSAKCGGTTIDRNFHMWMETSFGDAFKKTPATRVGPGSQFMAGFEKLKRQFDGVSEGPFRVCLHMKHANCQRYARAYNEVIISRDEFASMFRQDKNVPTKTIILCGGLSESVYVFNEIRDACKTLVPGAEVIKPENAWSAISQGAALKILQPRVASRRNRRSYGICVHRKFIEGLHREQDAFEIQGIGKRVGKLMHWHAIKGAATKANKKVWLKTLVELGGVNGEAGTVAIYASEADDPPIRVDDPRVYKLGDVKLSFANIPHPEKKKVRSRYSWAGRQNHYVQKVHIGQVIQPESNTVEFIGRVGRKCVGIRTFKYEDIGGSTQGPSTRSDEDDNDEVTGDEGLNDEPIEDSEESEEELFLRD
ncbi:hypothetical protein DTO195F2_3145 [Paecilomyces variotii]|nr:hypothetical protein DTO195F2_3145 [Paecilomyces variotii]KAJ9373699.1 hypothetical protein DTO282E5_1483 [Paecilomyces variotii]